MQIMNKLAASAVTLGLLLGSGTAMAATVTSPISAYVSSDSSLGSSIVLPQLTVTEAAAGDLPVGTLSFSLPAGFVFDTSSVANVATTGTGLSASSTVAFPDTTHFSVTIISSSTTAGTLTVGSTTPLKVKATNGTSLATGTISLNSGIITGLNATTSFGSLTQVAGTATKLMFTTQPPTTSSINTAFSSQVMVTDQFGNPVLTDNGRAITLSALAISPSTTSGSLLGTTTVSDISGAANFTNLSFTATGTVQLSASASPLSAALSNTILFGTSSPITTTTTPPSVDCGLHNGILVKVSGTSTVYMVVNCTLRPFTTPALFHAKGKKFTDIKDISESLFASLNIGKNVGEGDDNDSSVVINHGDHGTNASTTLTTTSPVTAFASVSACIRAAVTDRRSSVKDAYSTYRAALKTSYENLLSAYKDARSLTDRAARIAAFRAAQTDYRNARKAAYTDFRDSLKSSLSSYRDELKSCRNK